MVFVGELGMKATKQSLKQCKMAIKTEKYRGIKLTTCPLDDLYSILKCFSITSKGKNPTGTTYLHTPTRQSKATARQASSKNKTLAR